MSFPTAYNSILNRIENIDPVAYGRTRNYLNGAVSKLSPYISRGMISTKQVMQNVLDREYDFNQIEKFIQELAWRDYWQQVWISKGERINSDLKHAQQNVENNGLATGILSATTGIRAIDRSIEELYETGYMHNHLRMYTASLACNISRSHWLIPAKWMYYHLLDGDWASNALSWQWVAGTNSNKKYVANQNNINKYCGTSQKNSFLDIDYSEFQRLDIPDALDDHRVPQLLDNLPDSDPISIDMDKSVCIYNYYNLDPRWREDEDVNRILILEPSKFSKYPVSEKCIQFALDLSHNIEGIQLYIGEFEDLKNQFKSIEFIYKEHPLNYNYIGTEDSRDWMFTVKGYFPSFFSFWKKCKKELKL